jgi:gamma-glutamylcyclotransferase (GGCT)/AIG2-like uncharacterized protein YtfP
MTMTSEFLFVYGTLRRGSGHRMHAVLAGAAEFIDTAVFPGRMFLVAHYPGVIESDTAGETVVGDVYRLGHASALLRKLDRYEACDPDDPAAPYVRTTRRVALAAGGELMAWIYLYTRSTAALERIASGDFLKP